MVHPMIDAVQAVEAALEPDPVIDAYKRDVDRTLLRKTSAAPWRSGWRR